MDQLCRDAQQVSSFVRAVGEPLGEGVALEDLAQQGEELLAHVAG